MDIVVDAPADPERWRAAFRHVLKKPLRKVRIVGTILVVLGLLVLAVSQGQSTAVVLGATIVALGLVHAGYASARSVTASRKRLPMALNQPQRIELTDRSVRISSPLVTAEYAWAAFVRADLVPRYLLLMISRYQVMPVPVGHLSPQELAQLQEFTANLSYVRQ